MTYDTLLVTSVCPIGYKVVKQGGRVADCGGFVGKQCPRTTDRCQYFPGSDYGECCRSDSSGKANIYIHTYLYNILGDFVVIANFILCSIQLQQWFNSSYDYNLILRFPHCGRSVVLQGWRVRSRVK